MKAFSRGLLAIIGILLVGGSSYELGGGAGLCLAIGLFILAGIMLSDLTDALTVPTAKVSPLNRREPSI
jgi:hypothetical protein